MEDVKGCSNGQNGIPPETHYSETHLVKSITVDKGIITVTPYHKFGIETADTYILKPTIVDHQLTWQKQGGGIHKGYAQ